MSDTQQPEYAAIRPAGHYLMLLVRAALADDGRGGPWLTIMKTHTPNGSELYTHHISVAQIDFYSTRRLVMLTGDEALAFTASRGWRSLTDPSTSELRELGTYAVELHGTHHWAVNYREWLQSWCGAQDIYSREGHTEATRGEARGVRWQAAEQWLSKPTTEA